MKVSPHDLDGLASADQVQPETRRNKKRGASTAPKVGNSTAAGQRRTASGRVTRTVLATTKRCAGRPPKSPAKLSPGRPRKQRAEPTPVNAPSVIPKKSSRRSMRREYQPASPIVKIVKQTPALAPEDSSDAEHHAVLMHKFCEHSRSKSRQQMDTDGMSSQSARKGGGQQPEEEAA
ncbi:hypothetical protein SLS55_007567 [Diplodia seriata]|uniref:Uncharacterized protein n=1 Tax=Diplodia seriata TaxID=420778 RepID=A0ABR3CDP2_9PEZI